MNKGVKEFTRKISHLLAGIGVILLIKFFHDFDPINWRLISLIASFTSVSIMLIISYSVLNNQNPLFKDYDKVIKRKGEKWPLRPVYLFWASLTLALLLFSYEAIYTGLVIAVFIDSFATLIGLMYKTGKLIYNKSKTAAGVLGGILSTLLGILVFMPEMILSLDLAGKLLFITVTCGFLESIKSRIDDNFYLPFITCLIAGFILPL